ncbi:MAG: HD domain-containing protein [Treponema sp.]|jgi:poly(A) polymerase|nr:HD domain-containing protein [Treponema sp.]
MTLEEMIYSEGFSVYHHGFGAIDSWLKSDSIKETENHVHLLTNADTADLAKLFANLRYPGVGIADAALDGKDRTWYFRCVNSIHDNHPSFSLLEFYQDCKSRVFYDPRGIYPLFKKIRKNVNDTLPGILTDGHNPNSEYNRSLMDAALILAKYGNTIDKSQLSQTVKLLQSRYLTPESEGSGSYSSNFAAGPEEQRILLFALMNSADPGSGLEFLKLSGFINEFWPELAILDQADHSKDFHPEGNAWRHTLETFRYRKTSSCAGSFAAKYDIRLSLGLLMHDTGKPLSVSAGSRRYDGHAELGEAQTRKFLGRLGVKEPLINDICFLVRNHMLPAALPRLPLFRTGKIMSSPLFPLLMELYRCDESSSFKGLDGYYESSAAYQSFLKNKRNPYRSEDGKKLGKKQRVYK